MSYLRMKIDPYILTVLNGPALYTSMCPLCWDERSAVHPQGGAAKGQTFPSKG